MAMAIGKPADHREDDGRAPAKSTASPKFFWTALAEQL
jgi:hypothetical protein